MANKKIINILLSLFFAGFFIISCTKLYDTDYSEFISDEYSPSNEDDVTAIISAAYTNWRKVLLFWNGYWKANELCADEIVIPQRPNGWNDGGIYIKMHTHTWDYSDDIVYETWARSYSAIATCNRLLYQINDGYLTLGDEKESTVSELKVLRASYYYMLCDLYGNVPLDTLYDVEDGYVPVQNTRKEVFDFIVTEIKDNISNLSRVAGGVYYNRFNQWSARTLLAKMYLNAEVFTGTSMWDECIEQCDSIIAFSESSGDYYLDDSPKTPFSAENDATSKEIIFGIAIDPQYTDDWNTFDLHMQTLQPSNQSTYKLTVTPWGGIGTIPQFIDSFDPEDKRLTDNFVYGQQFSYAGDSLYCSMGDSINRPLCYYNDIRPINEISSENHGYRIMKFELAIGSSNIMENDFPLFRYTDVLMMKAECLLRNGNADVAAEIVTQVRLRAFDDVARATVTGDELKGGSTYNYGYINDDASYTYEGGADIEYGRFLDELAWEFNQEGRRRQDMIRFGAFTTKSSLFYKSTNNDYENLYPIPKTALESNANLVQNTGW